MTRLRRTRAMIGLLMLLQSAAGGQQPAQAPRARLVNRAEVVVNEDLLTRTQIERQIDRARRERPTTTPEEELQQQAEIVRLAVEELVLRQAGEDLGQPKEAIERVLDNVRDQQMERSGGLQNYSLELAADDVSSIEKRQELEGDIYSWTYTRVVTGSEPGKDGRLIADRYIRPGHRRRVYDYVARSGLGLPQIGGEPATFVLQQLVLAPEEGESTQAVRERALELRARATGADGAEPEDFNELVNLYGALKGGGSLSPDMPADGLAQISPELAEFAIQAAVGDVSPVFPARGARGAVEGWRMVRVLETTPGKVPPFHDVEVQRRIVRIAQRQLDDRRRTDAIQGLLRSAYVWSPELERSRAEREAAERAAQEAAEAAEAPAEPAPTEPEPGTEPAPDEPEGAPAEPSEPPE